MSARANATSPQLETEADARRALDGGEVGTWALEFASGRASLDARLRALLALGPLDPVRLDTLVEAAAFIDRAAVREAWVRALDPDGPGLFEVVYTVAATGWVRRVLLRGRVEFAHGRPKRAAGIGLELSGASAGAERETDLPGLGDAIALVLWSADASGALDDRDEAWVAFTGRHDELGAGWLEAVRPEERAATAAAWAQAIANRKPFELELRLHRADGSFPHVLLRGVPLFDAQGTLREWIGTLSDVTVRMRAARNAEFLARIGPRLAASLERQATFEAIAEMAVPEFSDWTSVHVCGPDGRLHLATTRHRDPERQLLLRALHDQHPFPAEWPHHHPKVMCTGEPELLAELPERAWEPLAVSEEHRDLLRRCSPRSSISVPMRHGAQILGVINFMRADGRAGYDADDLELAEEIARRASLAVQNSNRFDSVRKERDDSEEANRVKDEFLAVLSHELRTPLTSVLGWTRLLRSGALDPQKQVRALETIERNAQAQCRLIEDLLDVSRILAGTLRVQREPVDLVEVVGAAIEAARPAAELRRLQLVVELPPMPVPLLGDRDRLQQALGNLLSNAIKFSGPGASVRLHVATRGEAARVEVSDAGEGISPGFLPHLFERFRQADATMTRAHGGLGLGLAIVRHVVELHGGSVTGASAGPGQGATFTLELPLAEVRPGERLAPSAAAGNPTESIQGLRILVVEDDRDTREMLRELLETAGAEVTCAASAEEARPVLDQAWPQALVCDLAMPGEDGLALVRRLRAGSSGSTTVPALALTARARPTDREAALAAGFDRHASKPIDPPELLREIAALVAKSC